MWTRGGRKTSTNSLKIADQVFDTESKGGVEDWLLISRGERQSLEIMRAFKSFYLAYGRLGSDITESVVWSESESRNFKVYEAVAPAGSRVIALPANPDTIRGYTANVYLDELDIQKDQDELWRAVYPVLRGRLRLWTSSTPKRKGGRFYRIMQDTTGVWSKRVVDIYQAVAAGLPFDIATEQAALADPDAWAQEYELKWLDEASAWLPYELLAQSEADDFEPTELGWRLRETFGYSLKECYLGWDIARRRDLSILWVVAKEPNKIPAVEISVMRGWRFDDQIAEFRRLMKKWRVKRACLDQTGMGEVIVEQAQSDFGDAVEGVLFTNTIKQDLATDLKRSYEDGLVTTPVDPQIRDSLHSVKKLATSAGNFRFDAERTDQGHADYFWAQALAVHGANNGAGPISGQFAPAKGWLKTAQGFGEKNWRENATGY